MRTVRRLSLLLVALVTLRAVQAMAGVRDPEESAAVWYARCTAAVAGYDKNPKSLDPELALDFGGCLSFVDGMATAIVLNPSGSCRAGRPGNGVLLSRVLAGLKKNFERRAGTYYGSAVLLEVWDILGCQLPATPGPKPSSPEKK